MGSIPVSEFIDDAALQMTRCHQGIHWKQAAPTLVYVTRLYSKREGDSKHAHKKRQMLRVGTFQIVLARKKLLIRRATVARRKSRLFRRPTAARGSPPGRGRATLAAGGVAAIRIAVSRTRMQRRGLNLQHR